MARPTSSGDQSDMATEEDLARHFKSPSPPPCSPPPSISMVPYYQGSGQSPMDKLLQNRQQRPTNSGESDMANEDFNVMNFPPSPPFLPTMSSVPLPPPSPPVYFPPSSNSMVIYSPPRSPSSSNSMVVYYPGSGQSSMDNPHRQQRPTYNGDQSDMATEDFDVMIFLDLPPSPSPSSASNSMLVYQQWSGQSSMDFVDRPLCIAGGLALLRQELLQRWMDPSDKWGPRRRGIMSMNKENLPQSLECLGIHLLHLYVGEEFGTLLYWQGKPTPRTLKWFLEDALTNFVQGRTYVWSWWCHDLEREDGAPVLFATDRFTVGVQRIGPREWVAKIHYQQHFLAFSQFFVGWGRHCDSGAFDRIARVALEDARFYIPNLFEYFVRAVTAAHGKEDPAEDAIDYLLRVNDRNLGHGWPLYCCTTSYIGPYVDSVSGEVEPVRIGGEGTEEAEIAESQLDPGPSRKKQRKEKTPTGESGNKKTTQVKNVIPLDKILQVKELHLKGAAELLKVSQYALKRACRKHGINRWPPRNEHKTSAVVDQEGIPEPSDQASMTTVDTNNVALKEILPQFLLENPDENSCNDEVEAVGMGGVGTEEGEVKEGELNCGSSDKGERNEKTPQGERANNKGTGVRIEIPLEEILKYKDMCRKDAAMHLQVSISTLKRVCRGYQIYRWPPRNEHKLIGQSRPNESPAVVDQERNPQKNSTTLLPCNEESASMDTISVTIKARYEGDTFKFKLSKKPWGMAELEEQVKKRLQLETQIKYKDEDGDLISIVCDDDLQQCILSSRSQGTTSIVLFLEQKR